MKNKIKSCIDCINYHEEPVQGGHVPVCVAKKGEFYGSYVVKNQNDVCEKYCTPYMKRKKAKQPTLDECIKEWEKLGYTGSIDKLRIHMYKQLFGVTTTLNIIHIFRSEDRRYDFNMDGYFTKEESILLTKTLKALEEMKNE